MNAKCDRVNNTMSLPLRWIEYSQVSTNPVDVCSDLRVELSTYTFSKVN